MSKKNKKASSSNWLKRLFWEPGKEFSKDDALNVEEIVKQVILNMENMDKALCRRVVDFLTGCVYALDGEVRKVAQATYLFCPHGMDIVGDLENLQNEVDSYI